MSEIKALLDSQQEQLTGAGAPFEMSSIEVDGKIFRALKNAPKNLRAAIDQGRQHGDKEAVIYGNERWSYNDLFTQADAIAHQLVNLLNIKKGQRIAIAMRNYPEWMSAYIAIINIGAVAVPVNSWGQREELLYGLEDADAKAVFCDQRRFDAIEESLTDINCHAIVARPEGQIGSGEYHRSLSDFIAGAEGKPAPNVEIAASDYAHMLYTSGTTGRPKGAISTHLAVTQSLYCFELSGAISAMANMPIIEKMLARGYPATALLAVPLFHTSGLYANFLLSLRSGNKIVMMYKWDPKEALELIERERVTLLGLVPAVLWDLLNHPDFECTDTDSLFLLGGGGSAAPSQLKDTILKKVSDAYAGVGYGATETNVSISSATGRAFTENPRSAGLVSPLMEIKLCDENGVEVPIGERGEIRARSITMIDRYWNRAEETSKAFQNGWYLTGDIGYVDEQGYLYIVDRIKDMVIRGGENIYCVEVEHAIYEHNGILEAAAFGLPHDTLGEELALAVVLKEGQSLTAEQIQQHISERLATFKVPSHIEIRGSLPRNATQKVLKNQLREEVLAAAD